MYSVYDGTRRIGHLISLGVALSSEDIVELHMGAIMKDKIGVQFVGYSAWVRMENSRTDPLATLDFVSGCVTLHATASSGFILVNDLDHLATAVESISASTPELRRLVGDPAQTDKFASDKATERLHNFLKFARDEFEVSIAAGANVGRFVKQITSRRAELQDVLQQAAQIGSGITRRPYAEHINGIKKTGLCEVEYHGFAMLVDGQLLFKPDYQVTFVRQEGPNLLEVHTLGDFKG
jgi:hypothetical protein